MRSLTGSANVSRQPGRPSSTNPVRKLSRIRMPCGSVSATTCAPCSAARVPASSWCSCMPPWAHAEHVPVERATRRERHLGHQVDFVVGEAVEATGDDQFELRARRARRARRPVASISARVAARDGTGLPSPSLCVGACDDEKPIAPASSASCSRRAICVDLVVGGLVADRVLPHHDCGATPSARTGSPRSPRCRRVSTRSR